MARLTKEKTFNTSNGPMNFHVTQLGGMGSAKTLVRVAPLIPQVIALMPKGMKLADVLALKDPEKLKKFDLGAVDWAKIGEILSSLSPDEFETVTLSLLSESFAVGRDGQSGEEIKITLSRGQLDQLFAGCVWDLFALVGFALSLNYFNFSRGPGASAALK